jgi:hypothetical protein
MFMTAVVLVPSLVAAASAMCSRRLALGAEPAIATVVLTAVALTVALSTGLMLCAAGVVGLAELPAIAGFGHWSPVRLRESAEFPAWAGLLAGVLASALLASALYQLVSMLRAARQLSAEAARLKPSSGHLVVIDDPAARAFAVSGRHRRIIVTTTMLQQLDPVGRLALIAHENAHLRHRHVRYVRLGRLAAAANPLARPLARAVELAVERWADECAVRDTGTRAGVAHAVGSAALHTTAATRIALDIASSPTDVVDRVKMLLSPAHRRESRIISAALFGAVVVIWLATTMLLQRMHGAFEFSELAQR